MNFETIVSQIQTAEGNHFRANGNIYISPANMTGLVDFIVSCDESVINELDILITPYLINLKDQALYELHYYEFGLEVLDVSESFYVEHNIKNSLPKEIIDNIKPKAVAAKFDRHFVIMALQGYLGSMSKMDFKQDRAKCQMLEGADLFYQIF